MTSIQVQADAFLRGGHPIAVSGRCRAGHPIGVSWAAQGGPGLRFSNTTHDSIHPTPKQSSDVSHVICEMNRVR